ncbi:histidine phosphatase family protein [Simkania negevensis]|uniref:Phosphoglycerate mutase family protein n=1 Tax=Simkania negevensis (strain ATCC VR-1471 / DSM 27360 / Z) TaxID=331113 RepID=F8L9A3_SIMNZ|nr:histidine phosphatase family protein [Simkania negevensis]CCB89420.1 phosphoglycerate mutase family protein [Simkania negevensis Z]
MTTLIIVRHGNTFEKGETPRRVGGRTDIPLVSSGVYQAQCIGRYLQKMNISLDAVYSSPLLRTRKSADIILEVLGSNTSVIPLEIFKEIDYGPDENQTEEKVISRIGVRAIEAWNQHAKVPEGWNAHPDAIISNWKVFAKEMREKYPTGTILVTTSNGILRFSPHITGIFAAFAQKYPIKVSTGALCIFKYLHDRWTITEWNLKPS